MKVCLLTSGSVGNAIVIEHEEASLLIDCGITFKKFDELISQTELKIEKIKNLLVSHEHSDHIKGVGVITRKLNLQVWTTVKTGEAIYQKGILKATDPDVQAVQAYVPEQIAGFTVTPFPLSHDAVDPVGYIIERDERKVVVLTDTGYVSRDVMKAIENADLYVLEMNHNVEMLHMCERPWPLKQRILGDYGHLSNEDGAYVLSKVMGEKTKHAFLSHISQEANLPDLALMTLRAELKERNVDLSKLNLHMTYPLSPSRVVEV